MALEVTVCIYKKKSESLNSLEESFSYSNKMMVQIKTLQKRGRKVRLLYENDVFDVYEIINKPNESRINDLIFKI